MPAFKDWTLPIRIILIAACLACFTALFILLASNNRPAGDDFEFLNLISNYGWWNAMVVYWKAWNSRWLALLFLNTVLASYNVLHSFFLYHIITILALSTALIRLIKFLFTRIGIAAGGLTLFYLSSLLLINFFFLSFDVTESFFWINANQMYLWSVIFMILGFTELLKKEYQLTSFFIASISFFYVGGAFESYAVVALSALVVFLISELRKKEKNKTRIKLITASIFLLSISFSIELLGTGWRNRHEILGTPTLPSALFVTSKAFVKMLIWYIPQKIHWIIIFFLWWYALGNRTHLEKDTYLGKYFLPKLLLAFALVSFLILFPSCYLLRETPPFRTWTLISFLLSLTIAIAGFVVGYRLYKYDQPRYLAYLGLLVFVILTTKLFIDQKKITTKYAAAFDARESILAGAAMRGDTGIIELEPLPPSGLLYSAEIASDTSDYRNRHVKDYYKLKCAVKRKPPQ